MGQSLQQARWYQSGGGGLLLDHSRIHCASWLSNTTCLEEALPLRHEPDERLPRNHAADDLQLPTGRGEGDCGWRSGRARQT